MKILIVDNTIEPDSWGSPELLAYARRSPGATIHVRRAPDRDLPPDPHAYDRIIVSGSKTSVSENAPWIDELLGFINDTIVADRPFLGVCYGHQMLSRALGGASTVGRAALGEVGWARIERTGDSPLFEGVPKSFHTFASHFDEIKALAPGLRNLARSEACAIQAVQLGDRPIYGVQFHPERNVAQTESSFRRARAKLKRREIDPRVVLQERAGARLYDPQIADRLFGNFLSPSLPTTHSTTHSTIHSTIHSRR